MLLLSSAIRPPTKLGVGPLVKLAKDAACDGLSLEEGCLVGQLGAIAAECLPAWMSCSTMQIPMAESRVTEGKRLPYLCAFRDKEERLEAVKLAVRNMQMVVELGMQTFIIDFGRAPISVSEDEMRRQFADGGFDRRHLRSLLAERTKQATKIFDACRFSLEALLDEARWRSLWLAIRPGDSPWRPPSPAEAAALRNDFRGAPVSRVLDPGRLKVFERFDSPQARTEGEMAWAERFLDAVEMGLQKRELDPRRRPYRHVVLGDSSGLDCDLLPGHGEPDFEKALAASPKDAARILVGRANSPEADVAAAADRFRAA